ncbi:MAG: helix-turn-helix domain-containing protein [Bdellovibrionales bacterium]
MSKAKSMSLGESLIEATKEAAEWHTGDSRLKISEIDVVSAPTFSKKNVKDLRDRLNLSQPVFASLIGCSPGLVKAWEGGQSSPRGAYRRILQLFSDSPELASNFIRYKSSK